MRWKAHLQRMTTGIDRTSHRTVWILQKRTYQVVYPGRVVHPTVIGTNIDDDRISAGLNGQVHRRAIHDIGARPETDMLNSIFTQLVDRPFIRIAVIHRY